MKIWIIAFMLGCVAALMICGIANKTQTICETSLDCGGARKWIVGVIALLGVCYCVAAELFLLHFAGLV